MSSSRPVKSPFRPSRARITFLSFSRCRVGETPRRCDIIQAINSEAAASSESWSWLLMHERSSLFVSFHWVLSCELRVVIEILATVGKWHSFAVPRSPSQSLALLRTRSHSLSLLPTPPHSFPVAPSRVFWNRASTHLNRSATPWACRVGVSEIEADLSVGLFAGAPLGWRWSRDAHRVHVFGARVEVKSKHRRGDNGRGQKISSRHSTFLESRGLSVER